LNVHRRTVRARRSPRGRGFSPPTRAPPPPAASATAAAAAAVAVGLGADADAGSGVVGLRAPATATASTSASATTSTLPRSEDEAAYARITQSRAMRSAGAGMSVVPPAFYSKFRVSVTYHLRTVEFDNRSRSVRVSQYIEEDVSHHSVSL
jgi:hypothetical protein